MKNKLGLLAFFAMVFGAAFLTQTACYYDNEESLYPDGGVCDTSQVRYSVEIKDIFSASSCAINGCHSAATNGGGVTLDSYATVKTSVDNGTLIGSLRWTSGYSQMPKNGSQLTECDLQKIEKWIAAGAPNN